MFIRMYKFILLYLLIFTCIPWLVCSGSVSQTQINALYSLYNSTNGMYWDWKPVSSGIVWNFSTASVNPCMDDWKGITCNACPGNQPCEIISVVLIGINMTGTLPYTINGLQYLKEFDVTANRIEGVIGDEFCNSLFNLGSLVLNTNLFTGTISSNIGFLSGLIELEMSSNKLQGEIPSTFSNLQALIHLDLSGNRLTGSIPTAIGMLQKLSVLYVQINHFQGSVPYNLGNATLLSAVDIGFNNLTGTLPSSIWTLPVLGLFTMNSNRLSGSISSEIGKLVTLNVLEMDVNDFTGTIPATFANLSSLEVLDLSNNFFSGTMSTTFGCIPLTDIYLMINQFTGTLSSTLGSIYMRLVTLGAGSNDFTGSIPDNYGNFSLLKTMLLDRGYLTGSIPSTFRNLINLDWMQLKENFLSGTIPAFIGNLAKLRLLFLNGNLFTGSIPDTLVNCVNITDFEVSKNLLSGKIPSLLGQLHSVSLMSLFDNMFTGSIPISVANLTKMIKFEIYNNMFTGEIFKSICAVSTLIIAELDDNLFTGTIPASIGNFVKMQHFAFHNNFISGSIPLSVGQLSVLVELLMYNNYLSRTVPSSFSNLSILNVLLFNGNQLTGVLDEIFLGDIRKSLVVLDISQNRFHGTLPSSIYLLSAMQSLSASSNCFKGPIPTDICKLSALKTLDLSGLSASHSCAERFILNPRIYFIKDISGVIPECIFKLPSLVSFYASGNALVSPLYELPEHSVLLNLSLSNNLLYGDIPKSIQSRTFVYLDLAFNRLTGTVKRFNTIDSEKRILKLNNNRLSGNIPSNFTYANFSSLKILEGNIFACHYYGLTSSSLPHDDPSYSNYVCASDTLNDFMYTFVALLLFVILCVVIFFLVAQKKKGESIFRILEKFWELCCSGANYALWGWEIDGKCEWLQYLVETLADYRRFCCCLAGCILFLNLPAFVLLKMKYSVYAYEYGWIVSMGLMDGVVPVVVSVMLFSISVAVAFTVGYRHVCDISRRIPGNLVVVDNIMTESPASLSNNSIVALFIILNFIIIALVNIAYLIVFLDQNSTYGYMCAVGVSLFKIIWNPLVAYTFPQNPLWVLCLLLFNNVVAPVLATLFVDSSCFYNLIVPSEPVQSLYGFDACQSADEFANFTCRLPEIISEEFTAPFKYSYQCSASVARNYVPVYILVHIFTGLLVPIGRFGLLYFFRTNSNFKFKEPIIKFIKSKPVLVNGFYSVLPIKEVLETIVKGKYGVQYLCLNCAVSVIVLLTFGFAYPPLAFIICTSVCMNTLTRSLSIFVHYHHLRGGYETLIPVWEDSLAFECRNICKILYVYVVILVLPSFWFVSLFLVDMGGSLAVILLLPMLTILSIIVYRRIELHSTETNLVKTSSIVEMTAVNAIHFDKE